MTTRQPFAQRVPASQVHWLKVTGEATIDLLPVGHEARADFSEHLGTLLHIELFAGRLEYGSHEPHEEGHSYTRVTIAPGEDGTGQPGWDIYRENGGRDCDGPIAHTHKAFSAGGPLAGWCSREDGVQRATYDHGAMAAGY